MDIKIIAYPTSAVSIGFDYVVLVGFRYVVLLDLSLAYGLLQIAL